MSDIVERLETWAGSFEFPPKEPKAAALMREAKAEIERLTERGMEAEAWCKQLEVEIERLNQDREKYFLDNLTLRAALDRAADALEFYDNKTEAMKARRALKPKPFPQEPDVEDGM